MLPTNVSFLQTFLLAAILGDSSRVSDRRPDAHDVRAQEGCVRGEQLHCRPRLACRRCSQRRSEWRPRAGPDASAAEWPPPTPTVPHSARRRSTSMTSSQHSRRGFPSYRDGRRRCHRQCRIRCLALPRVTISRATPCLSGTMRPPSDAQGQASELNNKNSYKLISCLVCCAVSTTVARAALVPDTRRRLPLRRGPTHTQQIRHPLHTTRTRMRAPTLTSHPQRFRPIHKAVTVP